MPDEVEWIIQHCVTDPTSGSLRKADATSGSLQVSEGRACHARNPKHFRTNFNSRVLRTAALHRRIIATVSASRWTIVCASRELGMVVEIDEQRD